MFNAIEESGLSINEYLKSEREMKFNKMMFYDDNKFLHDARHLEMVRGLLKSWAATYDMEEAVCVCLLLFLATTATRTYESNGK